MTSIDQAASAFVGAPPVEHPEENTGERASWWQTAPLVIVLALFFGLPMLVVLAVSFLDFDRTDIVPAFLFAAYVHLFTLFMVVPIFNSMARIDKSLLEAARDAGAGRFRVVAEIVWPLSRTGIALGSIFVITLVMGDSFVVRTMSGGQSASVVSALQNEGAGLQDPSAAASPVLMLIIVTLIVAATPPPLPP